MQKENFREFADADNSYYRRAIISQKDVFACSYCWARRISWGFIPSGSCANLQKSLKEKEVGKKMVLYADYLYVPKGMVHNPTQLLMRFIVQTKAGDIVYTATQNRNYIVLPRECGFAQPTKYILTRGAPANIIWNRKHALMATQESAIEAIMETHYGGGILHLLPGKGKTVIALYLIAKLKRRSVIFVHTKDLAKQWMERANKFLVNPKVSLVLASEGFEDWNGDIVIASIDTVIKRQYPPKFRKQFFLTVFDEAHHMEAPKFNQVSHFGFGFRLGLTGTPYNFGYEELYFRSIGPVIYEDTSTELQAEFYELYTGLTPNLYLNADFNDYLTWIQGDSNRLGILVNVINNLKICGRKILVLSSRVKVSEDVAERTNAALLIGRVKMEERDRIRNDPDIDVIVATSQIAKEAIDIPWWDTLVIATPFSTRALQAVGRILREYPNKKIPKVFYLVDNYRPSAKHAAKFYKTLRKYFSKRHKIRGQEKIKC